MTDSYIDWPTLKAWCFAHGAKNDQIVSIQIDGNPDRFNVILEGNELDEEGKTFVEGLIHQAARWRTVTRLKALP